MNDLEVMEFTISETKFQIYKKYDGLINHCDESLISKYWQTKENDICFDIGFGPGTWSLVALARGSHVFAFDPKPYCIQILMDLLLLNKFSKGMIVPCGLMDDVGIKPFSDSSFKKGTMESERPVRTIDEFVDSYGLKKLDFINMDAEWTDLEVLKGGYETINRLRPIVVIEVHDREHVDDLKNEFVDYSFTTNAHRETHGLFLIATPN